MEKTLRSPARGKGMWREHELDYRKSCPNRFARLKKCGRSAALLGKV
jgi:hypothetical protein